MIFILEIFHEIPEKTEIKVFWNVNEKMIYINRKSEFRWKPSYTGGTLQDKICKIFCEFLISLKIAVYPTGGSLRKKYSEYFRFKQQKFN